MKIPIPADWDGVSWECYQIQWPKSDRWLGQLLGALTLYARGRYWDENTGSVTDAQAVGRLIFDRNYPLVKCSGEPVLPGEDATDTEREVRVALGYWELESDHMACIDISDLLKIENGVLYALDHCCNWVRIGDISGEGSVPVLDNPLYDPTEDPPQQWSACGKARTVIEAIGRVVTYMWDFGTSAGLTEVESGIKGNFPEWTMSRAAIYQAWAAWQAYEIIPEYNKAVAMAIEELAICKLAIQCEDTHTVSDDEYNHIRSSIRSAAYDLYSSSPLEAPNAQDIYTMWDWCADMIGTNDLKNLMVIGSADLAAECVCPDLPAEIPDDLDWFHSYDFTTAALFNDPGDTGDYLAGQGWESNEFGGYDINLVVPGAHKTNSTGSTQTSYMTWARITISACDAWVSGAKETKIRLHLGAGDIDATFPPLDGAQSQVWQGYLSNTTANGATSSVEMRVIRDECGTGAYHAIVSKLEIGGFGYDPLVDLP